VIIFPAVDIRGGRAVRLVEGDFARETTFGDDPVEPAVRWANDGATHLHVVDLDGARDGDGANLDAIKRIRAAFRGFMQVGGGVRSVEQANRLMNMGIDRIVIGSIIISNPEQSNLIAESWPDQVAAGLDARDGKLAVRGWTEQSEVDAYETAERLAATGVSTVIFTDIARDGTLAGPNLEALRRMVAVPGLSVIASGGVGTLDDVSEIAKTGSAGVIIGRALYDGRFQLKETLRWQ
jgi:phosphoribosylformimino-5-aminoimidazole carboxamide ribotide isomerase